MKPKKKKKPTISQLKRKLDKIFSEYIRKRDKGICISCLNKKPWKLQQAGHYVSRSHNILRYDERNVNCQDASCNIFKAGNLPEYALALDLKYREGTAEELTIKGRELKQFTVKELEELIIKYKELLK